MLDIQVALNGISDHVDVYFAVSAPAITSEILILTSSNEVKVLSEVGFKTWKQNIMDPIYELLFGDIPLSLLPQITYYLYFAVTPTGSLDNYCLWMTSFTNPTVTDYSGVFYVTLSAQPRWILDVNQIGNDVTFALEGEFVIQGQGSVNVNTMNLTGEITEMAKIVNISATFLENGQIFSGRWEITPGNLEGSIIGTKSAWPTYDVDKNGIPRFVSVDVIELSKISMISKFRSVQA